MKRDDLVEGVHFYMNDNGSFVLTELYHTERGYCCGLGCRHCPYEHANVPEPKKTELEKKNAENE